MNYVHDYAYVLSVIVAPKYRIERSVRFLLQQILAASPFSAHVCEWLPVTHTALQEQPVKFSTRNVFEKTYTLMLMIIISIHILASMYCNTLQAQFC